MGGFGGHGERYEVWNVTEEGHSETKPAICQHAGEYGGGTGGVAGEDNAHQSMGT